jgi:pantetheine-phosphate adenylyltransferase
VSERIGLYPGSFDPVHLGHVDVVRRALRMTDRMVVGVLDNPSKRCLFTVEERLDLLRETFADEPRVGVATFRGLLVDFARQRGATIVVRGLRAVSDFEYEFQMALMNRRLDAGVETVFLMPGEDHTYLSSRLVKEVATLGGDVSGFVSARVARALEAKRRQP